MIGLDTPMLRPDQDAALLALRPSYADAIAHAPRGFSVLPSINLVDGKVKQFDDGMLAALELARFRGWSEKRPGEPTLIRRLFDRVGPEGVAAPYLAAGLKVAGVDVEPSRADQAAEWLRRFEDSPMDFEALRLLHLEPRPGASLPLPTVLPGPAARERPRPRPLVVRGPRIPTRPC